MIRPATVALAISVLGAMALPLEAQLPDSPTGRRGNALIALLRGETELSDTFVHANFSDAYLAERDMAQTLAWLEARLAEIGVVEIEGVMKSGSFSADMTARSLTTGGEVEIRYAVDSEEPHLLTRLTIETSAARPAMSLSEMLAAVEEVLRAATDAGTFSGAVLIARGERILFEAAHGEADRRWAVANTTGTAFNLGSIDKIFTQVALAQLAAAGEISFDDTIERHLPDYPNPGVASRVTIGQLVTHTAGLGDIFTEAFRTASKRRFLQPRDYFELFAHQPLLFDPGEGEAYSNGGYMVLGAIIEAVSGESYHDYVRRRIFEPAGMGSTGPWAADDPEAAIATGYTRAGSDHSVAPTHENTFHIPYRGTPAGGGYSTLRDLLAFRHALVNNRLLDARYLEWLLRRELPAEVPASAPAIGLAVAGGGPGVNAILEMDGEWTVVVLANIDPPAASTLAKELRGLISRVPDAG